MSAVNAEIYSALIEAGASENKVKAAAEVFANYESHFSSTSE